MFRYATSLAARHGIVWVARWSKSWRLAPHDFDGRELGAGFVVAPENGTRVAIASIAVDEDRRLWVVDAEAGRVRAFTAFGRELDGLPRGSADAAGSFASPVAVDAIGVEDGARLAVASSEARRHALHVTRADGRASVSLRPRDVATGFAGLGRVAFGVRGLVHACEPSTRLVLSWRDGQFHFAFRAPEERVPVAVRALADGRLVLATSGEDGGALHLLDPSGRPLRRLACGADEDDLLSEPEDLALDEVQGSDRRTRVVVADAAGTRLSVWNLEGDAYGAFEPAERRAARSP
jgi:hypothetical protein